LVSNAPAFFHAGAVLEREQSGSALTVHRP